MPHVARPRRLYYPPDTMRTLSVLTIIHLRTGLRTFAAILQLQKIIYISSGCQMSFSSAATALLPVPLTARLAVPVALPVAVALALPVAVALPVALPENATATASGSATGSGTGHWQSVKMHVCLE